MVRLGWKVVEVALVDPLVRRRRPLRCADGFLRQPSSIVRAQWHFLSPPRSTSLDASLRSPLGPQPVALPLRPPRCPLRPRFDA